MLRNTDLHDSHRMPGPTRRTAGCGRARHSAPARALGAARRSAAGSARGAGGRAGALARALDVDGDQAALRGRQRRQVRRQHLAQHAPQVHQAEDHLARTRRRFA